MPFSYLFFRKSAREPRDIPVKKDDQGVTDGHYIQMQPAGHRDHQTMQAKYDDCTV